MPVPFLPPAPTADEWAAHELAVQRCRGTACFAAIAAHFGSTSPTELEKRIDGKEYETKDGEKTGSGKYRGWYRDGVRPSDATAEKVLDESAGSVDLRRWRDLPLWLLLARELSIARLQGILESMPAQIRRIVLLDGEKYRGRFVHSDPGREGTLALRNLGSIHAFIALLALARIGEILGEDNRQGFPAMCAFDLLPRVLYTHGPLRYEWEALYACLERIFWRRLYLGYMKFDFSIDRIRSNLSLLQEDPRATLDMLSWRPPQAESTEPVTQTSLYEQAKRHFAQAWEAAEKEDPPLDWSFAKWARRPITDSSA